MLPFDPRTMELVRTQEGRIPNGRRPVQGGYEESGSWLYHALAEVNGVKVPGKCGEHLVSGFPPIEQGWTSFRRVLMMFFVSFVGRRERSFWWK